MRFAFSFSRNQQTSAMPNDIPSIVYARWNDGWLPLAVQCATVHDMPTRPSTYLQRLRATGRAKPMRRDEKPRPSASAQGYGRTWQRLRLMVLREEPLCPCGKPATEVDHILAKAKGGDDSRENLQGLCKSCHSRKTVREDGALKKPTPGLWKKSTGRG